MKLPFGERGCQAHLTGDMPLAGGPLCCQLLGTKQLRVRHQRGAPLGRAIQRLHARVWDVCEQEE